jgi:hypothetical protein
MRFRNVRWNKSHRCKADLEPLWGRLRLSLCVSYIFAFRFVSLLYDLRRHLTDDNHRVGFARSRHGFHGRS